MFKDFSVFRVLEVLDEQVESVTEALRPFQQAPRRSRIPQLQRAIDDKERALVKELNRLRHLKNTTTVRHSVAVWAEGGSC